MKPATTRDYQERLLRVLVHIQEHLDETLALEDLAALACFSPYHFHRIFRGMVGESLKEHIRRLRLERAAHRLKFSDLPVTHIALEAGYEAHEAFTRAFRARFERSPSAFREEHQRLPFPPAPLGIHYAPGGIPERAEIAWPEAAALEVRIAARPALRVAFIRHVGPYDQVGAAWEKLMAWAGRKGLFGPGFAPLGILHDDPEVTPAERIRYDAALVVSPSIEPEGEVGIQETPSGDFALAIHEGPYSRLGETYAAICGGWLPASGRELRSAPALEVYLNNPNTTPPEKLRTEIHVPLAEG